MGGVAGEVMDGTLVSGLKISDRDQKRQFLGQLLFADDTVLAV